tara:strand:+ start:46 stop:549 length:504 start_codon:yes stop_codon:yes gene_type:complete
MSFTLSVLQRLLFTSLINKESNLLSKKIIRIICVNTLLIFFSLNVFGQKNTGFEKEIEYQDLKVLHYEVYKDYKEYPLNEEMRSIYQERLNRTKYCLLEEVVDQQIQKISTLYLFNKINPSLQMDFSINDINQLNPLKYSFNYYSDKDLFYLIDETNFVIIIKGVSK